MRAGKLFAAFVFVLCAFIIPAHAEVEDEELTGEAKLKKDLSIFNLISFPNEICAGNSNQNGTCYTAEECTARDGTASGSCASGYGVCCIISLTCGGSSSENCTYIEQSSFTATSALAQTPCRYTICPTDASICRIRLDFDMFVISSPVMATAAAGNSLDAFGDCATDTFTFTSPGNPASPVICGLNSGHHMIVDASDACSMLDFNIGASTATTRMWSIKATQYTCDDVNGSGGPPGCLQYLRGDTGNFASYNLDILGSTTTFPLGANSPLAVQHLSDQRYNVCIRRSAGMCRICYAPTVLIAGNNMGGSFGLSIAPNNVKSAVDTGCSADYITIPEGVVSTITQSATISGSFRFCGRILGTDNASTQSVTICSQSVPFRVGVNFDSGEGANELTATPNMASGTSGFWLTYKQTTC